jgi:hypothetical protein
MLKTPLNVTIHHVTLASANQDYCYGCSAELLLDMRRVVPQRWVNAVTSLDGQVLIMLDIES